MSDDFTFSIIKPKAVKDGNIGPILAMINDSGFIISAMKMTKLSREQAESFYSVHKERPFFNDLVSFMMSGPVVVMILSKENAVEDFRHVIGSTDPGEADSGTIRKKFATSLQMNAVHGSDSNENARIEAGHFFPGFDRFIY